MSPAPELLECGNAGDLSSATMNHRNGISLREYFGLILYIFRLFITFLATSILPVIMPSRRVTKVMAPEVSASAEPPRKRARLTQPIDINALLPPRPPAPSHPYVHSSSDKSDNSTFPVAFLTPEGPPSPTTSEINRINNAKFNQALRDGFRMHQKNQRPNTRKAYKDLQKKWMAWYDEKRFSDGYIIKNKKLLAFVQQVVMTRRVKKKKRRKRKNSTR
jgi:hypothetical protein